MDLIYSRNRIRIPKDNPKFSKSIRILIILFIAILTVTVAFNSLNPIFEARCEEKIKEIATNISNTESSNILKQKDYSNIVELVKDEKGNISIIKSDVVVINEIASDIALAIQKELSKLETEAVKIPVGSLLSNKFFAGFGPSINLKVISSGNIKTEIKTEFVSSGINQTMYRLYLELECEVEIITPFNKMNTIITNQVLLVETVIIGEIPSNYYNLEGIDSKNTIDLIK